MFDGKNFDKVSHQFCCNINQTKHWEISQLSVKFSETTYTP